MRLDSDPLRAILFDLDGTLLDSEELDILSLMRLFRDELGREVDELMEAMVAKAGKEQQ
jgi:beta-phosphoglucomutase-like phosphatase (HAD superfamily)